MMVSLAKTVRQLTSASAIRSPGTASLDVGYGWLSSIPL